LSIVNSILIYSNHTITSVSIIFKEIPRTPEAVPIGRVFVSSNQPLFLISPEDNLPSPFVNLASKSSSPSNSDCSYTINSGLDISQRCFLNLAFLLPLPLWLWM
jgi:hypothetical protein